MRRKNNEKRIVFRIGLAAATVVIGLGFALANVQKQSGIISKQEIVIKNRSMVSEKQAFSYDASKALPVGNKNEMVVITCDATGKNKEITDRVTLSGFSDSNAEAIKDITNLKDIENVNGEEAFDLNKGVLYWQNQNKDIVYEGVGSKELPVKIQVKYYLNGKETTVENLEGKSGKIKMVISYENCTKGDGFVPYSATSLITLAKDCFTNIVTNGTSVESGFNMMVYKSSFPGLEEDFSLSAGQKVSLGLDQNFVIEADAQDFSLDSVVTVVSNGVFRNLDDSKLNSVSNTGDLGYLLNNFSYQLITGASELCDGLGQFKTGLETLYSGSNDFTAKLTEYSEGIATLRSGLDQLVSSVSFLPEISDLLKQAQGALDEIIEYLKTITEKACCIQTAIEVCNEAGDLATAQSLNELQTAICGEELLGCVKERIIACLESASGLVQNAYDQVDNFYNGLVDADNGAIALEEASEQIRNAQDKLNDGLALLSNEFSSLENGGTALKQGAEQFSGSVNNAGNISDSLVLSTVIERIKELKSMDQQCHSYSGAEATTKGSTTYMFRIEY